MNKKTNTLSVFGLGVMSGLTSSCCAPVLVAAVTLTSLSPTIFQALVVSFSYVLGIVFPLFFLSLIYTKTTRIVGGQNRKKWYDIFRIIGGAIFILSGLLIIVFNYLNKIQMYQMEDASRSARLLVFGIAKYIQNPIADLVLFIGIIFVFYKFLKSKK